jgi:serine/threonine-protein kinase
MDEFVNMLVADRYALEQELGRGGMATVWRARDLRHERLVAIKILHPELAGAIGVERFVREVRLTARLQHPNIVPVLDSGVLRAPGGISLPWFAMAYLEGESLRARLAREQQLPIGDALRITEAVAGALQTAHRQGVLHRDIKPENVLLADDRVYVVDFGIAKALVDTGGERLTSTSLSIGTPAYMSPEQTSGGGVDARSDQYSLATMLYEMLTGEPPFTGNIQAIMARRFTEPARPLRPVRSTVPEPVERAVLRALERVPADRFPHLPAFVTALRSPASLDFGYPPGTQAGQTLGSPRGRWSTSGGGTSCLAAVRD